MYRNVKKIHMVGIGGSGMCGIAEILIDEGYEVTGSDLLPSSVTERLAGLGAGVFIGHEPEHTAGCDVVVVSSAVRDDNVEVQAARAGHIPVIRRAEMLAELMRIKYSVGVAGTHGKTTTTSMIGAALEGAGLDPTVVVGGRLHALGGHAKKGKSDLFVAEADEFDRSFLRLSPSIAVITNIDSDHLDYYKSMEEIKDAFVEFANKAPFYGVVICCMDDEPLVSIFPRLEKRLFTYGESAQADLQVSGISHNSGSTVSKVSLHHEPLGELSLQVPGEHNIKNALAAVAVCIELGVPFRKSAESLARFKGVHRRAEIKGDVRGRMIIDDFAHHPAEIKATLDGLRKGWQRRIVAVFQPHLYSRTRDLSSQFGSSFMQSDILVVTGIYGSREQPIPGVTGELVAEAAREHGHKHAVFHPEKETLAEVCFELSKPGDILITIGAGDIWLVGETIIERYGAGGEGMEEGEKS